jgi:hypothetical protein
VPAATQVLVLEGEGTSIGLLVDEVVGIERVAEAAALGERTRLAVAAAPVPLAGEPLAVTTSVGVASGVEDGWEGLVRRIATLHTGRPGCGKIPMTGSSPTRHRETGSWSTSR